MKRFSLFSLASLLLSGLIFLPLAFSQTNETLTISTYYPSPYGVYNELRLYPKAALLPGDCTGLNEGTMYYDNTNNQLMVCGETGFGIYGWQSTSSLWALTGTKLYPNNTTWSVGIGTTNPLAKLYVAGGDIAINNAYKLILDNGEGFYYVKHDSLTSSAFVNGWLGASLGYQDNKVLTTRFANVGIGTTVPDTKLQVRDGNDRLAFYQPSDNRLAIQTLLDDQAFAAYGTYGGDTENRLVLQPLIGNVGVGTTAPGVKLDVAGSGVVGIRYLKSGSKDSRIQVGDPTKVWALAVGWATAGDFSIIEEGVAGDRLYIKQGGNVGIGTTGPTEKLDVNGKARFRGGIQMGGVQSSALCSGTPPISCSNATPVGTRFDFCALSMMGGRDGAECEVVDLGGGQWRVDGRNSFGTTVKCAMRCFNYY